VSISVFRGVKTGRHVREYQRPTAITPEGFLAFFLIVAPLHRAIGAPPPASWPEDYYENIIGVIPARFSGLCLNPTSTYAADLNVGFSVPLTDFSILYAAQELACDQSATMRVTAYLNGTLAGSATTNATPLCPCTWQSQTLAFSSAQDFNSVVVQWVAPGPTCQDYGPLFVADNMVVTPGQGDVYRAGFVGRLA
jgi:hypothetical protein